MNAKSLIATALVLSFAGAGAAFAQEATQDFPVPQWKSSVTRSEVVATLKATPAAQVQVGEASAAPKAASTLTRAQVQAETREALRLGVIGSDEGMVRVATPAQAEQIRAAGLRALDGNVARAE